MGWADVLITGSRAAAAAGGVAGVYAVAGVWWAAGGAGFPFGAGDSQAADNGQLLRHVTPQAGGTAMAVLGACAVGAAVAMARGVPRSRGAGARLLRSALVGFGAALAVLLTLVLPEARAVKYLSPLGWLAF